MRKLAVLDQASSSSVSASPKSKTRAGIVSPVIHAASTITRRAPFIVGTPEMIWERLQPVIETGIDYFIVTIPREAYDQEAVRRFAREVNNLGQEPPRRVGGVYETPDPLLVVGCWLRQQDSSR
jgi:alkanesulfonate monooxygenase SsuD/methylene tetrahydromethanopterin reductase-like flavin-dependent oxidoreductase (luciferase family)